MRRTRRVAVAVAAGCWGVLAVAAWLQPDSRGYDTHTQLGLSPCAFPQTTGLPCPTCGMTTSFAHMVRGQVGEAIKAQAFGAALAVAVAVAACIATVQAVTGRDLLGRFRPRWWVWGVVVVGFFAAWGLKIGEDIAGC